MNSIINKTTVKSKPLMTVSEVAHRLNVHPNTLRRWSAQGIIKSYQIGPRGDRRFSQDEISRFLTELRIHGGNPKKAALTSV